MMTTSCCGEEGGVRLKACKACMLVKYCNAACQKNHWPKHKKDCKIRAAELRDAALFKDPPLKDDCPICFLPMPRKIISCISLPPATISSVPIYDFAIAKEELANTETTQYYSCCGKSVCRGCMYSFYKSSNLGYCSFCKAERNIIGDTTVRVEEILKRVDANDPGAICTLGAYYKEGKGGLLQDRAKAIELWTEAVKLGSIQAYYCMGNIYHEGGDMKKAKFHWGAAAMAGHEIARFNLGGLELRSGNMERAMKQLRIAASSGYHEAMHVLITVFGKGVVSRELIDSTLAAYNNSCVEMRSEARDAMMRVIAETI